MSDERTIRGSRDIIAGLRGKVTTLADGTRLLVWSDAVDAIQAAAEARALAMLPDGVLAFVNWFAEGPCGCDGDPQDPCDSCRALALLTRLDDLAGRAAASPDPPDTFGTGSLYDRERPAASPDSPDDRESLIAAEFFAAGMRAASPDERLREALRVMIDVFDRHDRWCGHYADAPGDGIIHKVPAARAALAADREAPDEPKETTT